MTKPELEKMSHLGVSFLSLVMVETKVNMLDNIHVSQLCHGQMKMRCQCGTKLMHNFSCILQ